MDGAPVRHRIRLNPSEGTRGVSVHRKYDSGKENGRNGVAAPAILRSTCVAQACAIETDWKALPMLRPGIIFPEGVLSPSIRN